MICKQLEKELGRKNTDNCSREVTLFSILFDILLQYVVEDANVAPDRNCRLSQIWKGKGGGSGVFRWLQSTTAPLDTFLITITCH